MTAMVLERETLPMSLSSFFAAPRIAAIPRDGGVFLTAAANTATAPKSKMPTIEEIFGDLQYDFGDDYKFNRDEANDYE